MNNGITKEMMSRFLNNESNKRERRKIESQIKKDPNILMEFINDEEIWNLAKEETLAEDERQEMWSMFKQKIIINKTNYFRWVAAACVAVIIVVGGYLFWGNNIHKSKINSQITRTLKKNTIENKGLMEKQIILSDGTEVILEPGGVISYLSNFQNKRDLYLEGQACFKVAHDKIHPFTVYEDGIGTTALGTKFWVDRQKNTITISLLEGKVIVRSFEQNFKMQNIYLIPGQRVSVNKISGVVTVINMEKKERFTKIKEPQKETTAKGNTGNTVWSNSAYTFSKAPLSNVIDKIQSHYHVVINIQNIKPNDYKFTGKIMYTDSLNTIMDAICSINNLSYKREGNTIEIIKK